MERGWERPGAEVMGMAPCCRCVVQVPTFLSLRCRSHARCAPLACRSPEAPGPTRVGAHPSGAATSRQSPPPPSSTGLSRTRARTHARRAIAASQPSVDRPCKRQPRNASIYPGMHPRGGDRMRRGQRREREACREGARQRGVPAGSLLPLARDRSRKTPRFPWKGTAAIRFGFSTGRKGSSWCLSLITIQIPVRCR